MLKVTLNINGEDTPVSLTDRQVKLIIESSKSIIERCKTWGDACEIYNGKHGYDPSELPYEIPVNDLQRAVNSAYQQDVITDVLNEDWIPDYNDSSEYKWSPYYELKVSGFGFSCSDDLFARTCVGARRVFQTKDKSDYFATQFINILQPSLTKN